MNDEERTGKTVAGLLNQSLNDVTPGTLYRLQVARRAVMEHYQPAKEVLHAGVGISVQSGLHWISSHAGRLLLTASLLFFLMTHSYWQKQYWSEDKTATTPAILSHGRSSKPQKANNDTVSTDTSPDKTVNEAATEEAVFREADDEGDYDNEAVTFESDTEIGDIVDSDDTVSTYDPVEQQDSDDATEASYANGDNQDSLDQEETDNSGDYAPDTDDTADFYDDEEAPDPAETNKSDINAVSDTDKASNTLQQ